MSFGRMTNHDRLLLFVYALTIGLSASAAMAQVAMPTIDATVVHVRKDCTADGAALDNCVESLDVLTAPGTAWLWDTRQPSESDPVVIDLGPGVFSEGFTCPDAATPAGGATGRAGWVSVRGSGRGVSRIGDDQIPNYAGVQVANCEGLEFTDVTIEGALVGVNWQYGGSATWSDVDIRAAESPILVSIGWLDACGIGPDPEISRQEFFGSTIHGFGGTASGNSTGPAAYASECADAKFYGGDIRLHYKTPGMGVTDTMDRAGGAVVVSERARLEVYGTSIRVGNEIQLTGSNANDTLYGVTVTTDDEATSQPTFRMHGGIISMNAGYPNTSLVGLRVLGDAAQPTGPSAYANTMGTAFVLNPTGTGTATRLETSHAGRVDAPLLWQAGTNPPSSASADLQSLDGQGIFVETDCASDGSCSGGSQSHLMVYDSSCSGANGPWRNMMTGLCRGDDPNS